MSTPVRRRRFVLDACLASALALAGCNKPKEDPVVAPDGGGGASTTGPGAVVELAPIEHPSQLLPRDTAVLVTGTSFDRAAEAFERDRLVAAFGPQYTSLKSLISGSVGLDLLDPAQWREAGLDPGGPLGFAVSSLLDTRVVVFASVSDRTKLVELLRRTAGKAQDELVEESYGSSASVLWPKGEQSGAIVLRDRFVAIVLDGGDGAVSLAKQIVTMDPNVSLAASVGYRKATGGLRAADLTTYLDLAGMVDQLNAKSEERTSGPENNWAQEELVRAQKEGAPPERLAELERQSEEVRADQARWRKRDEGQRALAELVFSGIEGVGLTATAKRGGPVLDGRVVAGPEAFVRRLFANREGEPVLPVALGGAPLWCGSGRVDPAVVGELLQGIAAADGHTYAELLAEGTQALGLDLDADLKPVMTGDAELCVTFDGTPGAGRMDPATQLGLGAIVRVTDAAKAKYLLAKMASSTSELGKLMRKRGDGYSADVPEWRTLHMQAAGDRIVISSDPELAKRLVAGDPGSMPSKIRPPAARGAMALPGTAVSQAFDLSIGVLFTMVGRSHMGDPWVVAPGMTFEEMQAVPLSAKSKKARKAMKKSQAAVEALEAKREAAQVAEVQAITDALGIVVTAATEDDRGFTLTGGQFLRAESLGQVVETVLRGVLREGGPQLGPADQEALDKAWQRHSEAQQAFTDARMEDAQKFQSKRGKTAPTPVPVPAG
jgi:hypothetical protein